MPSEPTIFVVDDEPAVRTSIWMMLERTGYSIKLFDSGQAFLDQFETTHAGCLISDVRMPGMDGMQLLDQLKSLGANLPIVLLSAHGDIAMAVRAMKIGAMDFLEKPIDPHLLRQKVAEAVRKDSLYRVDQDERNEVGAALASLTSREREVLELMIDGKNAKTIGTILGTSHNTVRVQRANLIRKMKADNIVDLIRMIKIMD